MVPIGVLPFVPLSHNTGLEVDLGKNFDLGDGSRSEEVTVQTWREVSVPSVHYETVSQLMCELLARDDPARAFRVSRTITAFYGGASHGPAACSRGEEG